MEIEFCENLTKNAAIQICKDCNCYKYQDHWPKATACKFKGVPRPKTVYKGPLLQPLSPHWVMGEDIHASFDTRITKRLMKCASMRAARGMIYKTRQHFIEQLLMEYYLFLIHYCETSDMFKGDYLKWSTYTQNEYSYYYKTCVFSTKEPYLNNLNELCKPLDEHTVTYEEYMDDLGPWKFVMNPFIGFYYDCTEVRKQQNIPDFTFMIPTLGGLHNSYFLCEALSSENKLRDYFNDKIAEYMQLIRKFHWTNPIDKEIYDFRYAYNDKTYRPQLSPITEPDQAFQIINSYTQEHHKIFSAYYYLKSVDRYVILPHLPQLPYILCRANIILNHNL